MFQYGAKYISQDDGNHRNHHLCFISPFHTITLFQIGIGRTKNCNAENFCILLASRSNLIPLQVLNVGREMPNY